MWRGSGDHLLRRSWNNSTGFPFVNELTINLLFLHIKHAVHPRQLGNLLIVSAHPLHQNPLCRSCFPLCSTHCLELSSHWHYKQLLTDCV